MSQHSVISPSKLDRIVNCIGSLYGPADDTSSAAAREGTACHKLLEMCIRFDLPPREFLNSTQFSEEFPVDIEMVEAVELFVSATREVMRTYNIPIASETAERHIVHPTIRDGLFGGTTDFQAMGGITLLTADLKYGRRQIYADSAQLTAYSLLALSQLPEGHDIRQVIQMVVQPRGNPQVSIHEVGQTELNELYHRLEQIATYVAANPDLAERASAEVLNPGPHCKYCPVRNGCVAREAMANAAMEVGTFTDPSGGYIAGPTVELTTDQLIYWHERADALVEFLKDAKKALMTRAGMGQDVPGYKVVVSWGDREFIDGDEKAHRLLIRKFGLKKKDLFTQKPFSVAQTEKLLKERDVLKDPDLKTTFQNIVESKVTGVRLVSSKARGEAVRPETIQEFLANIKEKDPTSDE